MYWIALAFFVAGVLVPEFIQHDYGVFHEEEVEVMLLLAFNGMIFLVFLWTDRTLRATQSAMRSIAQESHDVTKDLGKAYSHIGEMNRKIDIVTHFAASVARDSVCDDHYRSLCALMRESIQHVTRYTFCHIYIIDMEHNMLIQSSPDAPLLSAKQRMALARSRPGAQVRITTNRVSNEFLILYKTRQPLMIIAVTEERVKRAHGNDDLLKMIMAVALGILRSDASCGRRGMIEE